MLERIHWCIPEALSEHVMWYVDFDGNTCYEQTTGGLFEKLKEARRVTEVTVEVLHLKDRGHAFVVACRADEIWMHYNIPQEPEADSGGVAHDYEEIALMVERIFSQNKRWSAILPPLIRLGYFGGAIFRLGDRDAATPAPRDWKAITELILPALAIASTVALIVTRFT